MQGFWAMLTGKGEKNNRAKRKAFHDAIPDYGTDNHPAAASNSNEAMGYRRANQAHGLKSKWDHAIFDEHQRTHNPDGTKVEREAGWLARVLGRR